MDTLILRKYILKGNVNSFRGDLSDTSAKTATLVYNTVQLNSDEHKRLRSRCHTASYRIGTNIEFTLSMADGASIHAAGSHPCAEL